MKTLKDIRKFVDTNSNYYTIVEYNNKTIVEVLKTVDIDADALLSRYDAMSIASYLTDIDSIVLIVLHKSRFKARSTVAKKALLLHEIGHVYINNKFQSMTFSTSEAELMSQTWAIEQANRINEDEVKEYLIEEIEITWGEYLWNSQKGAHRRYINAHKLWIGAK